MARRGRTTIVSAGGRDGAVGNAGNPLDAVFEVRAPQVTITNLTLTHPPGAATKRDAASVMDPDIFPDFPSFDNVIQFNVVRDSLDDGIHIQGDSNVVRHNRVIRNGGYGVYLCGADNDCYPPGANAVSDGNTVEANRFRGNVLGEVADFGTNNAVIVR